MTARIYGTIKHSLVNGPGIRYVLFFQGCPHHCQGCHNPETHPVNGGTVLKTESIINEIIQTKHIDGITLSGGDPLMQPEACTRIATAAREAGLSVWVYTGWTYEAIISGNAGEAAKSALRHIDVLVDGPYVSSLKTDSCPWRGSANQRLIDVKKSLASGTVIPFDTK